MNSAHCSQHTASSPDAEDVFQLTHYELEAAIIDLMNAWSTGSPPRGPTRWPAIVAERRAAIAEWAKHDTPPALGPVPDVIDDPAIVMLWGITRESLDTWLNADGDATTNELRGFAASSGVVEGPARVVKSVEEIARLRKGDILVCQVTNPDLGAGVSEDRRRGVRHRWLDEPRRHRGPRVRPARRRRDGNRDVADP